jgi:hypothetical protein
MINISKESPRQTAQKKFKKKCEGVRGTTKPTRSQQTRSVFLRGSSWRCFHTLTIAIHYFSHIHERMTRTAMLLVAVLASTSFSDFLQIQKTLQRLPSEVSSVDMPTTKRLADKCYHVFLDAGANVGVHGRFLFEPEKYPDTQIAAKHFDKEFGKKRNNRDVCVFAFEPNPAHKARLEKVASAYRRMGWRYEFIPAAVGDEVGTMTFHHMNDEINNEWGFTSLPKTALM